MLDYYTEERKVATESGSDARKTMQEMVSNIALPNAPPTTITSSSSLPEAHSQKLDVLSSENETTYLPHDPISVLFLFAATRFAEKADVVSGWLQTLFKDLCRCAHLDVDAPEKSSSSRTYLPQIAALLKTAAMTSLPVDPQTLEAIILHFCNIDTKAYLLSDFEGLQVCLKYHSAVILKARKLQSPLLDSLLQKLTNLRQVFGMNNCNLFLGPIINAFVASKTPLDFVQLWRQQIKKSVGNPAMNEAYSLEYQESIWEEETLQSLTPALIQVLESRSQAASLLRELSDSLARVIHSEVLEIGEFLSIVVVLESSLKRSNSRSPPLPLLETIGTLYSIVREAVNLPAIPMVHRWRLWRVASIICKCWPEAQKINDIDTIHLSLMEQAGDVILSNLELNNSDRLETLRYTEALEAQQYLVAVTSMTKLDLTYIDSIIKSATTSMKGLSKNFITGSLTLSQLVSIPSL